MATESIESAERHKSLVSIFKDIDSSDDGATTRRSDNQSKNPADHKCVGCGGQADTFALFGRQDSKGNRNYLSDKKTKEPVAMPICNSCSKELANIAAERGVHIIPDSGSDFSKDTKEELKSIFKRDDWDKEESEWEQIGDSNKFRKRRKKRLQDVNIDTSDMFGRDKLKALQLELFKDALDASENTGEFKQWGKTPDKRSGRDPKTGRTKIDYLQDMGVYSAGGQAMGKREPQTSRGQADDATQSRLDRYSGRKYHPRQSGGRDSMDLGRLSQHENVLLSPSASDTGWAEGRERKQPKELWDDGDRKVPKGGKRPVEGKPKLGKPAGRTDNEKLLDVMTGNDEAAAETYDKEDERRRAERFGQDKRGYLITGSKAPKTKPSKKPSKDKKPERTYPKKAWEKWLENKSLGALGWGKLNRDGTKKKLRKRQPTLDDYPEDDNGDKKDET